MMNKQSMRFAIIVVIVVAALCAGFTLNTGTDKMKTEYTWPTNENGETYGFCYIDEDDETEYHPVLERTHSSADDAISKQPFAERADNSVNREIVIPTLEEVLNNGYPINARGETYGPAFREVLVSPDLELAQNEEGILGYIRQAEVPGASVSTLEEAAAYSCPDTFYMNMYAEDGITIIGQFYVNNFQDNTIKTEEN